MHVGIILRDSKIIHASGKVRIDTLDHVQKLVVQSQPIFKDRDLFATFIHFLSLIVCLLYNN